jgi:hypothetical protein
MPGHGDGVQAVEQIVEHHGTVRPRACPAALRIVMCAVLLHPVV